MLKLMLIDGEELENRAIIKVIDEMFRGRLVLDASRGVKQTIKHLKNNNPQIVILEYRGRLQDKIILMINRYCKQCYCIVMVDDLLVEQQAIEAGLDVKEFIVKPIRKYKFIEIMERAIISVMEEDNRKLSYKTADFKNNMLKGLEAELLKGILKNDLSNIDYNMYMEYLDFHFNNAFAVIIIGDDILFCYEETKKIVYQYIKQGFRIMGPCRYGREIICFVEIHEMIKDIAEWIDKFKNELNIKFNENKACRIRFGIGRCYSGIANIYTSYLDAKNNIRILN